MMTNHSNMLRWVFHRGAATLTCAIETEADRSSYDVCVLPHWNLENAMVEQYPAAGSALRRHAEIARQLRQAGWVAEYGDRTGTVVYQ